jgi:hypothetical protein
VDDVDGEPRGGDPHASIEEPPARRGEHLRTDQAKLIGAVKLLSRRARAVLVVVDYEDGEDGDVSYKIEEAGPGLDDWHDILGVLAAGMAYAQTEMFAQVANGGEREAGSVVAE